MGRFGGGGVTGERTVADGRAISDARAVSDARAIADGRARWTPGLYGPRASPTSLPSPLLAPLKAAADAYML